MSNKTKPANIAAMASSAKTVDDFQSLLSRVEQDLRQAESELSDLELHRKDVVLNGEDIDGYHRSLFTAAEKVKTLTAAVDVATENYEKALAKEAKANLEAQAKNVTALNVPAYQNALKRLHAAMTEVLAAADEISDQRAEIEGLNELVDRKSRADLRINVSRVRADLIRELAGSGKQFKPAHVERMPGETDDAFDLRRGNAQSLASRKVELADPIRRTAEQAVIAIQAHAFEMGAHERFRNHRVINAQRFIGPYGESVIKIQNADPNLGDPHHRASHPDIRAQLPDNRMGMGTPSSNA